MKVKKIINSDGALNKELKSKLLPIMEHSYKYSIDLLNREMNRCKTIYLGYTDKEELECFFMVAWEMIEHNEDNIQAVFMGLSATSKNTKSRGLIFYCYDAFKQDAIKWEKENQQKLVLWATTATPSAYLSMEKMFKNLNPKRDGKFSSEALELAESIKKYINYKSKDSYPFILKNVASNTLYSEFENERINLIKEKKQFDLFEKLNLNEKEGDRLLMIANL